LLPGSQHRLFQQLSDELVERLLAQDAGGLTEKPVVKLRRRLRKLVISL
jgi:hypothetical protein